jgi:hypothetical protein
MDQWDGFGRTGVGRIKKPGDYLTRNGTHKLVATSYRQSAGRQQLNYAMRTTAKTKDAMRTTAKNKAYPNLGIGIEELGERLGQ